MRTITTILIIVLLCFTINTYPNSSRDMTINSFVKMGKQVIAKNNPAWAVKIYQKYINHPENLKKLQIKWALVTQYNGQEGSGKKDRHDHACTMRTAAANRIPQYHYIWTKYGLRQILDSGAHSNDKKADRMGCNFWVDYWFPTSNNPIDGWNKTSAFVLDP